MNNNNDIIIIDKECRDCIYCQTTSKLKDLEACGFDPTLAR